MAELSRAGIAQRIATAREQAGLSQPELADLMHVHYRTIQDWESPKKQVTPWDSLDDIAQITGVERDWLLHGDTQPPSAESLATRLAALEAKVTDGFEAIEVAIERLASQLQRRGAQ
jgi:transcriptional regulator with XRE-family HTH domain